MMARTSWKQLLVLDWLALKLPYRKRFFSHGAEQSEQWWDLSINSIRYWSFSMNSIDPFRLLSALSSFCSLVFVLIRSGKDILDIILRFLGRERNDRNDSLPERFQERQALIFFYETWFWGIVSAVIGGILWGFLWKQSMGDTGNEPRGFWAILWPVITNIPGIIIIMFLCRKYSCSPWKNYILPLGIWIVGTIIGSWFFYSVPLSGQIGLREYYLQRTIEIPEFWFVIIWSALIAFPAFLFLSIFEIRRTAFSSVIKYLWDCFMWPSGLTIIVTTLAVGLFL